MDIPHKRSAQDTCFSVLDASNYDQIHSHDTDRAIVQVSDAVRSCREELGPSSLWQSLQVLLNFLRASCSARLSRYKLLREAS